MQFVTILLSAVALISSVEGAFINKRGLGLPAHCLKKGPIGVGWVPDDDNGFRSITYITDVVGPTCYYGLYSHFGADLSVANSDILGPKIQDVKASGAVAILSMQPSRIALGAITDAVAQQVAAVVQQYTSQGIQVYVRFAHEANLYVTTGMYQGTATDFKNAWAKIAAAVQKLPLASMYWCPNQDTVANVQAWWPYDPNTVDVVGIDCYKHTAADTFDSLYKDFYNTFSLGYNKPFVIGETGTLDPSLKAEWLKEISTRSDYKNYLGFSWFEYNKASEGDFRVATGAVNYAQQVWGS